MKRLVFPRLGFLVKALNTFFFFLPSSFLFFLHFYTFSIFESSPFSEFKPFCFFSSQVKSSPFLCLIFFCFVSIGGSYFSFLTLMCDHSEVRRLCPSVSFFFARLQALLGFVGGCPEVRPFVSRDSALGLVLADLSLLLLQSLDWFRFIREMSVEVRSNELYMGLPSSDKTVEVDTAISALSSLNPSSFSKTVLRAFHALNEVCSLDKDTLFRFRDRF